MKKKTKEELVEALKTINLTLLKLQSPYCATRKAQGNVFTDKLISQIKENKEKYLNELQNS